MKGSLLTTLPQPPPGKTGWPWTEASPVAPPDDSADWPIISIVTPSFNQGRFIEETIRSVLLQGYPQLEYIVMDGGSTDGSVEVIRKYAPWLTYWVSEKDRGQSHAINKGFERATGEVFGWLNSDDYFLPNALATLMLLRRSHPQAVAWVGACDEVDAKGVLIRRVVPRVGDKEAVGYWTRGAFFHQPSCLFSAASFRSIGGLDERLHYALDVDLWLRLLDAGPFEEVESPVSCARIYPQAKSHAEAPMAMAECIATAVYNGAPASARKDLLLFRDDYAYPLHLGLIALRSELIELTRYKDSYNHIINKPLVRAYMFAKRLFRGGEREKAARKKR